MAEKQREQKQEQKKQLSPKRQRFVNEYLKDLNATQAAIRAGYSKKTADVQGPRLLGNVSIKAAIDAAIARRNKRLELSQDKVIRELVKIGLADIKDYLSYRTEKTQVGVDEEGNPIFDYQPIIETIPSDEVDGTLVQEVSLSQKGVFSFKLADKMKALELLGRHLGMFNDKLNIVGDGLTINVNLTDEENTDSDGDSDEDDGDSGGD